MLDVDHGTYPRRRLFVMTMLVIMEYPLASG